MMMEEIIIIIIFLIILIIIKHSRLIKLIVKQSIINTEVLFICTGSVEVGIVHTYAIKMTSSCERCYYISFFQYHFGTSSYHSNSNILP